VQIETSTELADLIDGPFDAAIRFGEGRSPGLTAERLFETRGFAVAARRIGRAARPQRGRRWIAPPLLLAQAGEARRGAQFPGLSVFSGDVDAFLDGRLGLTRRAGAGEQGFAPVAIFLR
jgi:DNA-binding transcriptional LysR family regulator